MTEEIPNGETVAPLSSFRGRLDIHNFRFSATGQPEEVQKTATTPRFSQRLSSKIDQSFKPTKHEARSKTPFSGTKKRKADDPLDTTPLDSNAMAQTGLEVQVDTGLFSKNRSQISQGDDDSETSLSERSRYSADDIVGLTHIADSSTDNPNVIPNGKDSTMASTQMKKNKRIRAKSGYAPPSTFAHLPPLPDSMAPNTHVLFCGLNPGIQTAISGHAYSSPTNRFWKIMFSSGVLPVPCTPEEDRTLPKRFNLGLTNIVERPSRNGAQLSKAEMDEGVPVLEAKVRRWRPEVICLVGKSIWESVWRVHHNGKAVGKEFNKAFRYGWQHESENMGVGDATEKEDGVVYADDWKGARVFVASSTSGLAATLSPAEKERIWRELGVWVEKRRARAEVGVEVDSGAS